MKSVRASLPFAAHDLRQLTNTLIDYGLIDGTLIALMFLRVKSAELKF